MKFSDNRTEAAYLIAAAGRTVAEVGVCSEKGDGPMWQALVRSSRANLMLAGIDERQPWLSFNPGQELLVWLVEDEPGHVIAHKITDCDANGFEDRIAELTASFIEVTRHYTEDAPDVDYDQPEDEVDFGEYVSTDARE